MSCVAKDSNGNLIWIEDVLKIETCDSNKEYYCPSPDCPAKMHIRHGEHPCFVSDAISEHKDCFYESVYRSFGKSILAESVSAEDIERICKGTHKVDPLVTSSDNKEGNKSKPLDARQIYLSTKLYKLADWVGDRRREYFLYDDEISKYHSVNHFLRDPACMIECILDGDAYVRDEYKEVVLKAPLQKKDITVRLCFCRNTLSYSATLQKDYNRLLKAISNKKTRMVVVLGHYWPEKNYFLPGEELALQVFIKNARQLAIFRPGKY